MSKNPYKFTSDDILFQVYAERNSLAQSELPTARGQFFSKGQPCFHSSLLAKRYGWSIHSHEQGRVAIYGVETDEYKKLANDTTLRIVKAMRSKGA